MRRLDFLGLHHHGSQLRGHRQPGDRLVAHSDLIAGPPAELMVWGGEGRRSDGMQQIFMLGSPNSVVTLRVGVFKPDLFLLSKKHTLDGW